MSRTIKETECRRSYQDRHPPVKNERLFYGSKPKKLGQVQISLLDNGAGCDPFFSVSHDDVGFEHRVPNKAKTMLMSFFIDSREHVIKISAKSI